MLHSSIFFLVFLIVDASFRCQHIFHFTIEFSFSSCTGSSEGSYNYEANVDKEHAICWKVNYDLFD